MKQHYQKEDYPEMYEQLTDAEKKSLSDWISQHLSPRKTANYRHTCYGLKHHFMRNTGIYVFSGAFKGAMREAGYLAVDERKQNWNYRINVHISSESHERLV